MTEAVKRLLRVAIVGAPNAGKSTLLNKLVHSDISCVSNKVHTTRRNIIGVYTEHLTQLEFYDSPGIVTRQHLLKHRLEDSLYHDPKKAAGQCDLIAVVTDANNIRERKRLNKGLLSMLHEHNDKTSILILNKVDLVKDKRSLLDVGTRLSQGYTEGQSAISKKSIRNMSEKELAELNLYDHVDNFRAKLSQHQGESDQVNPIRSKHVIDLEPEKAHLATNTSARGTLVDPDTIGYKNFSQIFSISALNDDGVDDLKEYLLDLAKPIESWPHGKDYVSSQTSREVVQEIIRGRVMDNVEHVIPYLIKYKYLECKYDEFGSLHVHLELICPKKYMIGKLLGENGTILFKIIDEARNSIARTLGCDTKLNIMVK